MSKHYILNGHEAVETDLLTWAGWFEENKRRVGKTNVLGKASVSTVFLGSDHQFGDGPPLIFETMVFGGQLDQECDRYSTWDEAEAGHAAMVARVREREEGC